MNHCVPRRQRMVEGLRMLVEAQIYQRLPNWLTAVCIYPKG